MPVVFPCSASSAFQSRDGTSWLMASQEAESNAEHKHWCTLLKVQIAQRRHMLRQRRMSIYAYNTVHSPVRCGPAARSIVQGRVPVIMT